LLAASGLFLGAAVSLRVFYYYPAYAFVLAAAWACFRHRRLSASALVAFVLLAAFPALCQYACTYRNTGAWSLLDPQQTAYYVGSEMSLTSYGLGAVNRDPVIGMDVVGNDQLHWYTCADCMRIQGGWVPALLHGDFKGVAKVAWMRNEFYFGTYVSQPAIAASTDRISSPWIALANWLAVLSAAALFFRAKERWIPGVPLVFWMVSWSLAILIHPENRFAILILVLAWTLGPLAWMAEPYPPAERG